MPWSRERGGQVHPHARAGRDRPPRRRAAHLERTAARPAQPRHALDRGIGMVYQEMLLFPNLGPPRTSSRPRVTAGSGGCAKAECAGGRGAPERPALSVRPEAEVGSSARPPAAPADRARAGVRVPHPHPGRAHHQPHRRRDRAPVPGPRPARSRGVTLIYVSHKLEEVFRLCDRITVLRRRTAHRDVRQGRTSPPEIVRAMVGRDLETPAGPSAAAAGRPCWRSRASPAGLVRDVSLTVRAGEIVAFSAWSAPAAPSSSRPFSACTGPTTARLPSMAGRIRVRIAGGSGARGQAWPGPRGAPAARPVLQPERARQPAAAAENAKRAMAAPPRAGRAAAGFWSSNADQDAGVGVPARPAQRREPTKGRVGQVAAHGTAAAAARRADKGVDVGAKWEIQHIVRRRPRRARLPVVSSELPEVLALAPHRRAARGRVQGELPAEGADEESVMRCHRGRARGVA